SHTLQTSGTGISRLPPPEASSLFPALLALLGFRLCSFPCALRASPGPPLLVSPPLELQRFLQLGCIDEVLWSSGGNFRGKKVLQARKVRRRAADFDGLSRAPAGFELNAGNALEDVDSVG